MHSVRRLRRVCNIRVRATLRGLGEPVSWIDMVGGWWQDCGMPRKLRLVR